MSLQACSPRARLPAAALSRPWNAALRQVRSAGFLAQPGHRDPLCIWHACSSWAVEKHASNGSSQSLCDCSADTSRQEEENEQQSAEAEEPRNGQSGQQPPRRRRDAKETRGEALTKPYIPFSAGPRDCLGQRFGMTEVSSLSYKIYIAQRKYDELLGRPQYGAWMRKLLQNSMLSVC